jgi:hypothetical protein
MLLRVLVKQHHSYPNVRETASPPEIDGLLSRSYPDVGLQLTDDLGKNITRL